MIEFIEYFLPELVLAVYMASIAVCGYVIMVPVLGREVFLKDFCRRMASLYLWVSVLYFTSVWLLDLAFQGRGWLSVIASLVIAGSIFFYRPGINKDEAVKVYLHLKKILLKFD